MPEAIARLGMPGGIRWLLAFIVALLAACSAIPSAQERRNHADALAAAKGWRPSTIATASFDIQAYGPDPVAPRGLPGERTLVIYIEGDGFAWVTPSQVSDDPTPRDPVALRMALAQPGGVAAYLARPCQYTMSAQARGRSCQSRYWADERFAETVVQAESQAVDELKRRHGATRLMLVGYSGGGAVAALLAARRVDVTALVTVAGNLDHEAWTRLHHVRPLKGSLNPVDEARMLGRIPQWHLSGGEDKVVPAEVLASYLQHLQGPAKATTIVVPPADHACCWAAQWPALWESLGIGSLP